ncbi:IPT/TIG domain-containing protein [Hymenobacter sp. APR13]|uniref:IPT/TIG domain-containing protein n=1 Tax=Hymenobacter sp. APR13 TaxID=1356852 RepID=UPI0004E04AA6|nr:IPT/TIG domain-containing protein [Hymenobacter sp. APR13]AII54391.1 hypothetical protein N008_20685 [Hymenobacter sp. APR13]
MATYTVTGANQWAKRAGGSSGTDEGFGIAVRAGQLAVGGFVNPPATFDAITLSGSGQAGYLGLISLIPTVTTSTPTAITSNSATLGGNVTAAGAATVTERGVVYLQGTGTPTTSNTKALVATSGIVIGTAFSGTVLGLTAGTQYTVRAYAINSAGTSYGTSQTFTTLVAPTLTSLSPNTGAVGTPVTLTGTGFTAGSTVRFNTTEATSVTVNSATSITATVPAGATTGNVIVTTPNGTSNGISFTVCTATPRAGYTFVGNANGRAYYRSNDSQTGSQAYARARAAGAYLVTINDAAENAYVQGLASGTDLWLGLNDFAVEGTFRWQDGSTASYRNWAGGEPNNFGGNEDYVVTKPDGTWNDTRDDHYRVAAYGLLELPVCTAPPSISGLSPASGPVGRTVTITGTDFTGVSSVALNGTVLSTFTLVNSTTITFVVPAGATSGPVLVTAPDGSAQSVDSFTVLVPPTLTSISPNTGAVGTSVTLTGSNLTGATAVTFSGTSNNTVTTGLTVSGTGSSQTLTVNVPAGATTGLVTVTTPNGTSSGVNFTVTASAPTLTALGGQSRLGGQVGFSFQITGTGFVNGATTVRFNSTAATAVNVTSSTALFVTVPAGATTGPVTVTTSAGTSNSLMFTVAPTIATATPAAVTATSATLGGTVLSDNGSAVIERGIVYQSATSGIITRLPLGTGTGTFSQTVTGLTPSTLYAVQAYARNADGNEVYEDEGTMLTFTTLNPTATLSASISSQTNVRCFSNSDGSATVQASGGTAPYTYQWSNGGNTATITGLSAGTYNVTVKDANGAEATASATITQPTALSLVMSKTDATTNGAANGTATVQVSGGTPGYSYVWSNGATTATITGLTAGTYTVFVTDANNCEANNSVTVGQPAPAPQDLVISTGTTAAPVAIAAGTYTNVTITGTGVATLGGAVTVNGTFLVQGTLNTNCQALTGSGSFTLAAGATLSICDGAGLTATGSTGAVRLTGPRSFSPDASYVYNGTQAQATGTGLPAQVLNLTSVNPATLTLSQPVAIRQVLTLNAGSLNPNGQALTLLSDASGTALIANLGAGAVQGSVTVQRYIDGSLNPGLGYRHLAAPVIGATVAGFGSGGTTPVVNSAYNASATPGSVTPFPTVYFYNQARLATSPATSLSAFDKGWQSPAALTDPAQLAFQGFTVQLPGASTLSFTGQVGNNSGIIGLSRASGATAADAGWNLIGNPYPAPLDLSTIPAGQRTRMDAAFYTYESTSQYGGNYRSFVNGIGEPLIGSSQAFFVRVSEGQTSGSLALTNANRVTTYAQQAPVRRGAADTRPQLQLQLSGQGLNDALTVYAQAGATAGFDREFDAAKLWNPNGLSVATLAASGEALAIDGRPAFPLGQPVPLTVQAPQAGSYSLTASDLANLPAGTAVTLVDLSTGTRTPLLSGTRYSLTLPAGTTAGRLQLEVAGRALSTASQLAQQLSLYPNPTDGQVQLVRPAAWGGLQVQVLNSIGQPVLSTRLAAGEQTLSVQQLPVGVYTLRLTTQQGQTLTKRLVRQ